jgi:hypothetical protein
MTPPSASRTPPQLRWGGSQMSCLLAIGAPRASAPRKHPSPEPLVFLSLELPAKPWWAKRWSSLGAGEGISAISASVTPIRTGAETLATAASLRGVSAVSASDTPITAGSAQPQAAGAVRLVRGLAQEAHALQQPDHVQQPVRVQRQAEPVAARENRLAPRMPIQAGTRRAFRRRLPAPPPSPRRVLDDRAVFAGSGSSAGHGDAPRCGSIAHVSHIARIVKCYLSK